MLPKLNHSSSDELSLKRCPLIIIAFFMIMQIEVAFATPGGGIMPAAFSMNIGAPVSNAYVANQPSAAFGPIRELSTNTINKDINNDMPATGNKEGVDLLANNFGVPREVAQKGLEKAKAEYGIEYPDSPYAKFADMDLTEYGDQHGKHKGELKPIKEHDEHYDEKQFGTHTHHQNSLSAIDKNVEMDEHDIMEAARHENISPKLGELQHSVGLKDAESDLPNLQGNAPRRTRFLKKDVAKVKNRVKKIVRQTRFNRRRDGVFTFLLGKRNYKSKGKKKKKKDELRRK